MCTGDTFSDLNPHCNIPHFDLHSKFVKAKMERKFKTVFYLASLSFFETMKSSCDFSHELLFLAVMVELVVLPYWQASWDCIFVYDREMLCNPFLSYQFCKIVH